MNDEKEKKRIFERIFGGKKQKKKSCCCFEVEEIPEEIEALKEGEEDSCCKDK